MKSNIKVSIHGNTCVGCIREEKDIMISLDGNDEKGNFVFLDAFLSEAEALNLIQELNLQILNNKTKEL